MIQTKKKNYKSQNEAQEIIQQESKDYEYIQRSDLTSMKYAGSIQGKIINVLDLNSQKDSLKNMPIVCSYADMDFKLSPAIKEYFIKQLSLNETSLGYTRVDQKLKQLIISRLQKNVYEHIRMNQLITINSMLSLYYIVVTQFTNQQDNVLIFTPAYYRFIHTLKDQNRNIIQYELKIRQTDNGFQYWIDFQELQQLFDQQHIKLVIWANSHNPTGRLWKKQELEKLKLIIQKHKSLVFSDDIFCQSVEDTSKYSSLLQFEDMHQNLIWASSCSKTFNCSGSSFAYAIVPNQRIINKIASSLMKLVLIPKYPQIKIMQSCYTVGEEWRVNTIRYIQQNYETLKRQFKKRQMSISFSTLDSGYIPVLDFSEYYTKFNWRHSILKAKLQSQNIFPTYLNTCYISKNPQQVSGIRLNIAMNRKVIFELVNRFEKILRNQ